MPRVGAQSPRFSCPQDFIDECGPQADCYEASPNEGFYEDLQLYTPPTEAGDHTWYDGHECGEGKWGATVSVDLGMAFHVTNWGTCDYGGGMHDFDTQYVYVGVGEPISTWWHEGLSYFWGCEDLTCHDNSYMDDMFESCVYE